MNVFDMSESQRALLMGDVVELLVEEIEEELQ